MKPQPQRAHLAGFRQPGTHTLCGRRWVEHLENGVLVVTRTVVDDLRAADCNVCRRVARMRMFHEARAIGQRFRESVSRIRLAR